MASDAADAEKDVVAARLTVGDAGVAEPSSSNLNEAINLSRFCDLLQVRRLQAPRAQCAAVHYPRPRPRA